LHSLEQRTYFWKQLEHEAAQVFSREELDYMIDIVKRFNQYVSKEVEITPPDSDHPCLTDHDLQLLEKFETRPVFSASLRNWWRLWVKWWYQNVSSWSRASCLINWEAVTWIDITSSALQFLRILQETAHPDLGEILHFCDMEDPYSFLQTDIWRFSGNTNLSRKNVKRYVMWIIHPWSPNPSISLTQQRIDKLKKLLQNIPEAEKIISYFVDGILRAIESIEQDWSIAIRHQVYKEEVQLLYAILEQVMSKNTFMLPIHDAFIMPKSQSQKVQEIISGVTQDRYQKNLHFHEGF